MEAKKESSIYLKAALAGIAGGIIICMVYLFAERDREAADGYRDYYKPLVASIENFKKSMADIYTQAETVALATEEVSFEVRRELIAIINTNIRECDKSVARLNSDFVPISARNAQKDMIAFFDRSRALLERIVKALETGVKKEALAAEFDIIGNELEKLSLTQISGYTYY